MIPTFCNGIRVDAEQKKIEVKNIARYTDPKRKDKLKINAIVCRAQAGYMDSRVVSKEFDIINKNHIWGQQDNIIQNDSDNEMRHDEDLDLIRRSSLYTSNYGGRPSKY